MVRLRHLKHYFVENDFVQKFNAQSIYKQYTTRHSKPGLKYTGHAWRGIGLQSVMLLGHGGCPRCPEIPQKDTANLYAK